jgi:hypothetical protein
MRFESLTNTTQLPYLCLALYVLHSIRLRAIDLNLRSPEVSIVRLRARDMLHSTSLCRVSWDYSSNSRVQLRATLVDP